MSINFPEGTQSTGVWRLLNSNHHTGTSRNPGGSWTDHFSGNSFTVPSGGHALVWLGGNILGCYESEGGGGECRFQLRGAATYTSHESRGRRGYFDHFSGDFAHSAAFGVSTAGSYTPYFQIRTWRGNFIANHYSSYAQFSVFALHTH